MENTTKKLKYCPDCGKKFPLSKFNKNKSHKDGLQSYCQKHQSLRTQKYIDNKSVKIADLLQKNMVLLTRMAEIERQYELAVKSMAVVYAENVKLKGEKIKCL